METREASVELPTAALVAGTLRTGAELRGARDTQGPRQGAACRARRVRILEALRQRCAGRKARRLMNRNRGGRNRPVSVEIQARAGGFLSRGKKSGRIHLPGPTGSDRRARTTAIENACDRRRGGGWRRRNRNQRRQTLRLHRCGQLRGGTRRRHRRNQRIRRGQLRARTKRREECGAFDYRDARQYRPNLCNSHLRRITLIPVDSVEARRSLWL